MSDGNLSEAHDVGQIQNRKKQNIKHKCLDIQFRMWNRYGKYQQKWAHTNHGIVFVSIYFSVLFPSITPLHFAFVVRLSHNTGRRFL